MVKHLNFLMKSGLFNYLFIFILKHVLYFCRRIPRILFMNHMHLREQKYYLLIKINFDKKLFIYQFSLF